MSWKFELAVDRVTGMPAKSHSILVALITLAGAAVAAPKALAADTPFQQGVKAFTAKNYRDAYSHFEACLKKSPSDVNALYYEALCCYQLRDLQGAKLRYQRIIDVAPTSSAAGMARTALSSLSPTGAASGATATASATTPTVNGGDATAADAQKSAAALSAMVTQLQAAAAASGGGGEDSDYASLPDKASFYFTHESGGHMGVMVSINNHQVPALFDTGAGAYFYKDQLMAAGVDCNNAVRSGFARGWAGTPVPVYSMDADVKVGTLKRRIKIIFQDSGGGMNQNLIGQTFLKGYQYEIDDKGGRVDMKKSIEKTAQKVDPLYDIPLTVTNSRDIIQIEVNGHKVSTFIDTGAFCSILNQQTASECGVEATGSQRMTGVGGSLSVGLGTAKIRVGPINKDFTVRIGGSAGNCIGQDFMEGWRFKIDREHGLLRFFH